MLTDADIRTAAREIADSIIQSARNSGNDPVAWVAPNSMMPPLRWFDAAERVHRDEANHDGEAFAHLVELIESHLSDADVALECPDCDNALYAVDLNRFEYVDEHERTRDETLQDEWRPVYLHEVTIRNTVTGEIQRVTVRGWSFTDAALTAAETPFGLWDAIPAQPGSDHPFGPQPPLGSSTSPNIHEGEIGGGYPY